MTQLINETPDKNIEIQEKEKVWGKEYKDYFPSIVGQNKAKNVLSLHIDGYKVNKFIPATLLVSPRGFGKTELIKDVSNNLTDKYNNVKQCLHLNCASVKNLDSLVNQIFAPYQNTEITYIFDEGHLLPPPAQNFMLSVISPNKDRKSYNYHNGIRLDWNHEEVSMLFCSTNPERFSDPFLSRLERVDLEEYCDTDLIKILYKNAPEVEFQENIELEIVSVCRGTPREIVKLADKIKQFCGIKHNNKFNIESWKELKSRANINLLGLNSHEIKHLMALKECGELTLTMLAAKLRLDRTTVQRDIEKFLMEKSLININLKRSLSKKGYEVLQQLDN